MDSVEPSLVPQWLKGNSFSSNISGASSARGDKSEATAKKNTFAEKEPLKPPERVVKQPLPRPSGSDRPSSDRTWKSNQYLGGANGVKAAPKAVLNDKPINDDWAPYEPVSADRARPGYNRYPDSSRANGHKATDVSRDPRYKGEPVLVRDADYKAHDGKDSSLRTYHAPQISFEREFPSLKDAKDGPPAAPTIAPSIAPYKQNYLSARGSASWSSKLAEVTTVVEPPPPIPEVPSPTPQPVAVPPPQPPVSLQTSWNTVAATSSSLKGTDVGHGASLLGAPGVVDKQRLEQLVAKQTKQLIPVVANVANRAKSGKQPSVQKLDANKPIQKVVRVEDGGGASPMLSRRNSAPVEKSGIVAKSHTSGSSASVSTLIISSTAFNAVVPATGSTSKLAPSDERGKVLGKNRNSFFESLRRKSNTLDQTDELPHETEQLTSSNQSNCNYDNSSAVYDECAADTLSAFDAAPEDRKGPESATAPPAAYKEDSCVRLPVSAEEEAFLRSLGWTEADGDDDEGLTEEEIAAFKAASELRRKPTSKAVPILAAATHTEKLILAASYGSELSSSDSDSD